MISELWKWLDTDNKNFVPLTISSWWTQKSAPKDLFLAQVAPIFKKGDTDVASNYSPIPLLNSMYKLYMMMIRSRMQEPVERHLYDTYIYIYTYIYSQNSVLDPIGLRLPRFT